MKNDKTFTFDISLSVLNHLGRSLYRSFATVLGEAISNSWDADAKNVEIYVNRNFSLLFFVSPVFFPLLAQSVFGEGGTLWYRPSCLLFRFS